MTNKGRLYDEIRDILMSRDDVVDVILDETFNPPHKPAAFSPFDVVLQLDDPIYASQDEWTEQSVKSMLTSHGVTFDRIINIEEDKHSSNTLVFVSLEEF